jgi:quinol-cytochrome oxidoreductase complex cytochrome b subunit
MRIVKQNSILNIGYNTGVNYPTPINITYFWNFGIFALLCLGIQLITGILLAMNYIPNIDLAFNSVEHIMRDVNYGWLIRYIHANGASLFFIAVYTHLFRGLYYGSYIYPREFLWCSGVIILLLMIITGFFGYVLPWGQMSFRGATVITNVASTIPVVGEKLVIWLWGGFAVANPTLNKFYSLHYLMPFVILALVMLHIIFLHENGSSNPLGINFKVDQIPFNPYFTIKDFYSVIIFIMFFSILVFFLPNLLGHPDNYIPANPESTPVHIVPEWYLLPFYAILRSIPNKLGGVIALFLAIVVIFILPFLNNSNIRISFFRPLYKIFFWFFFIDCLLLGWIGAKPIENPYLIIGQIATAFYFIFILLLIPIVNKIEYYVYNRYLRN